MIAFVDIETTGLDPLADQVLEVAIITDDRDYPIHFSVPIDERRASAQALKINRYRERRAELAAIEEHPYDAAALVADALKTKAFVGNNPRFDDAFLRVFLERSGFKAEWHYHLVDIKALVAGRYQLDPPWTTSEIEQAVGIRNKNEHTALADAEWVRDAYYALDLK